MPIFSSTPASTTEPAVVITTNTNYLGAANQGYPNLRNVVIPFVEANYNVSTDAIDRAFAGLSAGSAVTQNLINFDADEFGYYGLSQVEFKRDVRDGGFKLMEINPRLWQWHGLATACGVDLPRIAYADLVGEPPAQSEMNGHGKRWAITLLPGERPALQRPPYVDAVFARDDPKPALVHLARVVRSALP